MSTQRNAPPFRRLALALAIAGMVTAAGCQREAPAPTPAPSSSPTAPPPEPDAAPPFKPATDAVETTDTSLDEAFDTLDAAAREAAARWEGKTFEEFEQSVYKEPWEGGKYIISGDIAVPNRKQLEEIYKQMVRGAGSTAGGKLIVARAGLAVGTDGGGRDLVWSGADQRALTYCVSDAFGPRHAAMIADMTAAAEAWEVAAAVDFIHLVAEDARCDAGNANVLFDVRPVDVDGEYLARAFFPGDPRGDRNVLVDESSFDLEPDGNLTLVGILRHELGHVLGWRHEHTRPESGACFEDANWRPLTSYDRFSVMHYPQCNGGGDWTLALTDLDRFGAACIYGPAAGFTLPPEHCPGGPPPPDDGTGVAREETFADQSVPLHERKDYDPFPVVPGTVFEAVITAAGAAPGDPDLYVRFGRKPMRTGGRFDCRPYLFGAEETCRIDVPALDPDDREAFVMVYGYSAGTYTLKVRYTAPN